MKGWGLFHSEHHGDARCDCSSVGQRDACHARVHGTQRVGWTEGEEFFTAKEVDAASEDMEALNSLLADTTGMNKLCLFSIDPDIPSEGGSVDSVVSVDGHPVLVITMDLKWQESEQPIEFCRSLAADMYGWCVIGEGEAHNYEMLSVNGELFNEDLDGEVWDAILEEARSAEPWAHFGSFTNGGTARTKRSRITRWRKAHADNANKLDGASLSEIARTFAMASFGSSGLDNYPWE